MKITVFTSNQPRHLSLIEGLASIADEVYAVIESSTIFPGMIADAYGNSPVMKAYFERVMDAEKAVFGTARFLPLNVHSLVLKSGDLSHSDLGILSPCLNSDKYVVFGASYIKGALIDQLISKRAYNIHMGVSPYYRGSSCNFWAAYDGNFDYVGATIHLLSKGLDSGDMLMHAFPGETKDPFLLGMKAVKSAHQALIKSIKDKKIDSMDTVKQEKSQEIRYTRHHEFTDDVAAQYLKNIPSGEKIIHRLRHRDLSKFLRAYIDE